MIIRTLICLLLIFNSFKVSAQCCSQIIIYHDIQLEGAPYTLSVFKDTNTIALMTRTYTCQEEITLDSISPGKYRVELRAPYPTKLFFSKEITVAPNDVTNLYINVDISEINESNDTLKIKTRKSDGEFNIGYQNGKLENQNSVFKNGFMIGMGGHYWKARKPHLATIFGFGFNYRRNQISKDTSFIAAPVTYKKTEESYNYLDAHVDFKIRFCSGNQLVKTATPDFILELGAIYNLPLYFRYRGNYEGNKIIQAWGIHQFTDVRAFVNIGYYPCLFFYEYRLSDFVIGNYPEVPRSTFGIRLLLTTLIN